MNRFLLLMGVSVIALCACTPPEETPAINIPALVSIPAGSFIMGDQSMSGSHDETPAHPVTVSAFAMSQTEITQAQYADFANDTGRALPNNQGWSNDNNPVINVSLRDAYDYVNWLSDKTGKTFTIPTEAQWEYAARAGSVSVFANGSDEHTLCRVANIADQSVNRAGLNWSSVTACDDGQANIAPVGSYAPNVFGLYDMHGNVWEWVLDCANNSYAQAPSDGSAWVTGDCAKRGIRGGSYKTPASSARSSNREFITPSTKSPQIGFRVVREA